MSNERLEGLLEKHYQVANKLVGGASVNRDMATALAVVTDKIVTLERLQRERYCPNCGIRQERS